MANVAAFLTLFCLYIRGLQKKIACVSSVYGFFVLFVADCITSLQPKADVATKTGQALLPARCCCV